ncbi:hypothetical protein BDZ94DRAFT_1312709 [Collybia nuda]|uniref:Uncharacterized protein n=1 Tax=Collybia nuda TaxID=64659 RepID=A0A9P6CFL6_9AGAR|nr:hypothetical protein BDZ94DRAFT_1312709 [Collybia nuda]
MLPSLLKSEFIRSVTINMPVIEFGDVYGMGPALSIIADYVEAIKILSLTGTLGSQFVRYFTDLQALEPVTLKLHDGITTREIFTALASLPNLPVPLLILTPPSINHTCSPISRPSPYTRLPLSYQTAYQEPLGSVTEATMAQLGFWLFTTLKRIYVHWPAKIASCNSDIESVSGFLKPILELDKIEELVLTALEPYIAFSDLDILSMARKWPQLEPLRLEHRVTPRAPFFETSSRILS